MSTQNQQIKLYHYRNGTYQGHIKSKKRNGKGILITDKGQIMVGSWKNDKLSGQALVIYNPMEYGYGEFNRGQFQGWFLFQSNEKILVSEFNSDRPINKQLFINKDQGLYKLIIPKNPIYQCIKQEKFDKNKQKDQIAELITSQLQIKLPIYTLKQYLQNEFKNNQYFQISTLSNGYMIFKFNDSSNPVSLGFVFNKNNQIISYGSYINNKLSGYGCKYETSTRYEGIFLNGFLNGDGLKFNSGKYSFGNFQNGTLVEPIFLDQRSLASEEKLKQLKKLHHLQNLNFSNVYLPDKFIGFKGISQITFEVTLKQEFFYNETNDKIITPKKVNNIASRILNKQDIESKSIYSISQKKKQKNPEDYQSNSDIGKGFNGVNSLRKFRI